MNTLMTIKEAAEYLRLNYMTVYRLAKRGVIPAFKVGGNWRLKKEILDDWLVQQARRGIGTVLVVDDDARVRDLLKDIISEQGHRVVTAESGEAALDEVSRQHFDLIFLDLVLRGASGVDTLHAIKDRDRNTTVVIVTGYGDDPIALKAKLLGPLLLIRKPFRKSDVVEVLKMVLTREKGA
ncbi:MAG: response regulator [Chloroflexi bacterium]|nr:response regulator [Chloroflexota bacterium]